MAHHWRTLAIELPLLAGALAGCSSETGTSVRGDARMDDLVGSWRNYANVLSMNTCPLRGESLSATGGYLIIEKTDDAYGSGKVCDDAAGTTGCTNEGLVVVHDGKASHFSVDRFGPYGGIDCRYDQVAVAEITRSDTELVAKVTASIANTVGDQCDALQASMQEESGSPNRLRGCWIGATYGFTSR